MLLEVGQVPNAYKIYKYGLDALTTSFRKSTDYITSIHCGPLKLKESDLIFSHFDCISPS